MYGGSLNTLMEQKYATYITTYNGNLLPPFYIGYARMSQLERGYRGSVASKAYKDIWALEIKENPERFSTKIIKVFETKLAAKEHEAYLHMHLQVHRNPLYINKSLATTDFYVADPSVFIGRKHTEATKEKIRQAAKAQHADPIKHRRHKERFLASNGNHADKIWINKDGKHKRVTSKLYEESYSDWTRGRVLLEHQKFYNHQNRQKCPVTGQFLKKENNASRSSSRRTT